MQETLVSALESASTRSGRSSERTWLLGIAIHKLGDHHRRARREQRRMAGPDVQSGGAGEGKSDRPDDGLFTASGSWRRPAPDWRRRSGREEREELDALERCLERLPAVLRDTIWLRDVLDVPSEEICRAEGIAPGSVWARLHRARTALRLCLSDASRLPQEGAT